ISLAMETPSLVIVGAPHFFSRTTLRPLGPSVTFTASARAFRPRSRPRRASSSYAIVLAMALLRSSMCMADTRDDRRLGRPIYAGQVRCPRRTTEGVDETRSHRPDLALTRGECQSHF